MKINISIDDELLEKIDTYAKANYMSRSGFFTSSAVNFFNQQTVLSMLPQILEALPQILEASKNIQQQ